MNPSHYSVALVSEGAMFEGGEMVFQGARPPTHSVTPSWVASATWYPKIQGSYGQVQQRHGRGTCQQKLGYLVRCGDPDAIDSIVPMA